jgi:hypothetical protein
MDGFLCRHEETREVQAVIWISKGSCAAHDQTVLLCDATAGVPTPSTGVVSMSFRLMLTSWGRRSWHHLLASAKLFKQQVEQ